ncbi:plasmid mobilization protein [Thalassorhabdomicrobium marinisediminis]|uniref:plasmid mobilization protein n=1 Tax=Thalassorhabdomicrobium marinisediminis TaxID=2170577 RepID=UPI00248F9729|nr:hypothetical protein [Thalassorhabdomicrobium marinisediminis]
MANSNHNKSKLIKVYMTAAEKAVIQEKAAKAGQGVSGYMLDAGLRRGIPLSHDTGLQIVRLAERSLDRIEEISAMAQDDVDGLLILAKLDQLCRLVHLSHRLEMSPC